VLLLAIDTATSAITVALHDGAHVVAEQTTREARQHGELVAPGIAGVLSDAAAAPADVTTVVAGTGPGPFTGLRVGLVSARTFGYALGIPVLGVCSLDALAHEAWQDEPSALARGFVVATDARRKEVYWARYGVTPEGAVRDSGPEVAKAASIEPVTLALPVVGRGGLLYAASFGPRVGPLDVSAGHLAALAAGVLTTGGSLGPPDPLYLRRPDAAEPRARKPVLS